MSTVDSKMDKMLSKMDPILTQLTKVNQKLPEEAPEGETTVMIRIINPLQTSSCIPFSTKTSSMLSIREGVSTASPRQSHTL